jgi:hypothetical protein
MNPLSQVARVLKRGLEPFGLQRPRVKIPERSRELDGILLRNALEEGALCFDSGQSLPDLVSPTVCHTSGDRRLSRPKGRH